MWILLCDGTMAYFDKPRPIAIQTIAKSLSRLCRFTGHCEKFYSVAEHSVKVSKLLPTHLAMHGLLHDAAEVIVGDISSPLKGLLPKVCDIETQWQEAILSGFGLKPLNEEERGLVHNADMQALAWERKHIMRGGLKWEGLEGMNDQQTLNEPVCFEPADAERQFMLKYDQLTELVI